MIRRCLRLQPVFIQLVLKGLLGEVQAAGSLGAAGTLPQRLGDDLAFDVCQRRLEPALKRRAVAARAQIAALREISWQGGLAGMIVGGAMVFIWKYLIAPMGGVFAVYELLPAFLLSLAAIVLVSLATKAPDKSITDEFELAAAYNKPIHK